MGVRGDLRLLETAVRRRYPIDAERAAETVNAHLNDPDPRVALRAASIAAIMEGQNQKDEHAQADALRRKLLELAIEYGAGSLADGQDGHRESDDHRSAIEDDREAE